MADKKTFEKIRAAERLLIKISKEYGWKLVKRARSLRSEATYLYFERPETDPRCVDKELGDTIDFRIATHPAYHERSTFADVFFNPYRMPPEDTLRQAFESNRFTFNEDGSLRVPHKNNPRSRHMKAQRNPASRSYIDRLIKEFGVTDSPYAGFWMLPDGNFLDGASGSGRRYEDHRIITHVKPAKDVSVSGERDARMRAVAAKAKLIRWMPESWKAELMTKPTRAQLRTLSDLIRERSLELFYRISPTRELQRTYESYEAEDATDELRRMFGV